ncbi:MAG: sulfate adenylyltransferase, partial [Odoribacteraceae bacterium]|nr:sulfate adenylyltransferase [Odoribacteraceae bacterium]
TIGVLKTIHHVVNINTLDPETGRDTLRVNDIARVTIRTARPLVFDSYSRNRVTGSLILVDPDTFETVAGGMIE